MQVYIKPNCLLVINGKVCVNREYLHYNIIIIN